MTDLTVREARRNDAAGMAAVLNPIIRAGGTTAYEAEMTEDEFAAMLFDRRYLIAASVAQDADGIAGFQWIDRLESLPPDVTSIATFARLEPKRPGVGRALFARTREAARAAGCREIDATIRADNTGGLAFYEKMGFLPHSITRSVPLSDGTPVDRVHKRFRL